MTVEYGFHANIFTVGNADIYSYFVTKPYYRLLPHSFGVLIACIYREILQYRIARDELKKDQVSEQELRA